MAKTVDIQPRFTDFDMFGHINNTSMLQYMDLGKALFFNELTDEPYNAAKIGSVVVNINVNFTAPTVPGEPLKVRTSVCRLGNRSFALRQSVFNPETGVRKCDAVTTMAGFDVRTQSSADIPSGFREALAQHLEE